jgi:predicted AlkP superfamily phosphohydrolase/phosphomutase
MPISAPILAFLGRHRGLLLAYVAAVVLLHPTTAAAYIGPGAGFALVGSLFVFLSTVIVVFASFLIWPFRKLWLVIKYRGRPKPWVKRLIIVGLDGQDPRMTDRYMGQGKLPNFQRLAEMGCYHRLGTTYPAISPVAWSSFCTGTHPAKHNIFDFLDRDRRTYLPLLSSTEIGEVERTMKIGKYRIPLSKPIIRLLRKSKPFWTILGEYHNWSTVLRVPITFPPEKFYGAQLSAMCTPDLLGTQGTFLLFTTRPAKGAFKEGGARFELEKGLERFETAIEGPENSFIDGSPAMKIPMTIQLDKARNRTELNIDGTRLQLESGVLSEWTTLSFPAAPAIKVQGVCRFMVTEMDEHFSLYVTPINIDPDKPSMPISHPSYYATYMAKKIGSYCTLGLAEDTWALNEGVTDDATFLQQAYDIDNERQEMFFAALDRLREGSLTCVFDGTDRIQHMFWRYLDEGHPAARGIENPEHANAVENIYAHNDVLLGKVLERVNDDDMLMVISDHGFTSFRRGVNLNRWLLDEGYLTLKEGADGSAEWLRDVDWSKTKAYVLGLTGMFLNIKGREGEGIVGQGAEAQGLKDEIITRLKNYRDAETGETAINDMFDTAKLYQGPYLVNAPDLIIGFNEGYRQSWDCATGIVATPIIEDNVKAWSGDHCVDPRLVPGIFFCNRKIDVEDPDLIDIAPTAVQVFGLQPPPYMEGQALFETNPMKDGGHGGEKKLAAAPEGKLGEVAS